MKKNEFFELLKKSGLSDYENYFKQLLRPSIDIRRKIGEEAPMGCSHIGGLPYLPMGTKWPRYEGRPYRFLGQINFSEIKGVETNLPKSGLLTIFFHDNANGSYLEHWLEGYIHTIYTEDLSNLQQIYELDVTYVLESAIEFSESICTPYDKYQVENWPLNEDETDIYDEIRERVYKSKEYLFGYPSHRTLAYDPTPGEEWIPLLTADSDDSLEWCWHDFDKLMIFIKKEDLKSGNFSNLKIVEG